MLIYIENFYPAPIGATLKFKQHVSRTPYCTLLKESFPLQQYNLRGFGIGKAKVICIKTDIPVVKLSEGFVLVMKAVSERFISAAIL